MRLNDAKKGFILLRMEQIPREEGSKSVTLHEALTYIRAKSMEVQRTGRIDTEPSDFKVVEIELTSGLITPKEAVERINALIEARQDYN